MKDEWDDAILVDHTKLVNQADRQLLQPTLCYGDCLSCEDRDICAVWESLAEKMLVVDGFVACVENCPKAIR